MRGGIGGRVGVKKVGDFSSQIGKCVAAKVVYTEVEFPKEGGMDCRILRGGRITEGSKVVSQQFDELALIGRLVRGEIGFTLVIDVQIGGEFSYHGKRIAQKGLKEKKKLF